jgi:hypothetical protein
MRLKDTHGIRHIHKWDLYAPPDNSEWNAYLGVSVPEPNEHMYRKCECGAKMRCKTEDLMSYSVDCKPFADEEWVDV